MTDHHHGARAWLLAGYASGICSIEPDPSSDDPGKFWPRLVDLKIVHLKDKDGIVMAPDALPNSLEQLPDDPYRTLAWMVRKKDGFCRALMGSMGVCRIHLGGLDEKQSRDSRRTSCGRAR